MPRACLLILFALFVLVLQPLYASEIRVEGFRFTGNSVAEDRALSDVLKDVVGRSVSLFELEIAVARITQYYRERGYMLAQAYVPEQEIVDGIVEIGVLEGRYGRLIVENHSDLALPIVQRTASAIQPGGLIRAPLHERAVLLLSDLHGV